MTFPPPNSSAQSSIASSADKTSSARGVRTQQSAWGAPGQQPGVRRGLTPLSTSNLVQSSQPRRLPASNSPSQNLATTSPLTSTFSSVLASSNRAIGSRNTSSPSSASPFPAVQPGASQSTSSQSAIASPRSRTNTPFSASNIAPGVTPISATAAGGGGSWAGGGGGTSRSTPFSPSLSGTGINSPTAVSFEKSGTAAASSSAVSSSQSSLSKISIAQVFLLLDSINEKEGKGKWESKAEQIRKLVDSNGMEVFSKYFRRLLVGNSPQIFSGTNKNVENAGNYQLLVKEMQKVSQDPDQAQKIADTIDGEDGDIFRDFDLSTFIEHFKLDPVGKTALAVAFRSVPNKSDLRAKADVLLSQPNNIDSLLQALAIPDPSKEFPPSFIASLLEKYSLYPPRNFSQETKENISRAISHRFERLGADVPEDIHSALQLVILMGPTLGFVHAMQKRGVKGIPTVEAANDFLSSGLADTITEDQVANALIFMLFSQHEKAYSLSSFVTALLSNSNTKALDWQLIVNKFDRKGLDISTDKFLDLYSAIALVAQVDQSFDIQCLWGGHWENRDAQLSCVKAFLSSPPERIDVSNIPNFRRTFDLSLFDDASEEVRHKAEEAQKSPFISLDAVAAFLDVVIDTLPENWDISLRALLLANLALFSCSAFALLPGWTETQEKNMQSFFVEFLLKRQPGYDLALHGMWKQNSQWIMANMFSVYQQRPVLAGCILDHALEHGWLEQLLGFPTLLTVDLATLAHRRRVFDLAAWIKRVTQSPSEMGTVLTEFLHYKAEDEIRVQRSEQAEPNMVTLAVSSVNVLLEALEDFVPTREHLTPIQRICIQAYPRLINYGEGFDEIIEANGAESNAIPAAIDKQMQELFGKMYHEELTFKETLEIMRKCKSSHDPIEQDLFTCMVHGLLDEYHCFHEYPVEALTKTAVLFGGMINFKLINGVPLKVGLGMVLDSLREHSQDEPMYKFGVEAAEQFIGRLEEWKGFCSLLTHIPTLQGTDVYQRAQEVLQEVGDVAGVNGMGEGFALTNGNIDDFLSPDSTYPKFRSLHVDLPIRPDFYETPEESVQDKVLFVLNNVSEQNIVEKLRDLRDVLQEKHHQWFAGYLVEQRAKQQPNFQQLYLDLLGMINNKMLWAEVLRETYSSSIRLLNAESALNSPTERAFLKNLGSWLGSLTIAKDQPIKHKNIYFKDLLLEGYETQRLIVVIPFTCKVLVQGINSTVFKPPNPWLMEILALLMELYYHAELKLNMKFEIEVLCKELLVDHSSIEPSNVLRERLQANDELVGPTLPENLDAFDELSLGALNRSGRNERFSPAAIIASIPADIETRLVYPPSSNGLVDSRLRQIVQTAVTRAIAEIIAPVVERSVTIASISTAQLILKDFAMEPDEERVRDSAIKMVKALAGSLALVTCKEPLRMSITNNIRIMQAEFPDQPLPEGSILMCVNDNLDTACEAVEKAAEEQAIPEIDRHIKDQLEARRRHRALHPDEQFIDPIINRWAFYIPEPYRQAAGGLNPAQRAIYDDFQSHPRGAITNHVQSASIDSNRQLGDILQEPFQIPNLPTPAEPPALPHQTQQQQEARMQPPHLSTSAHQGQVNGFMEPSHPREKVQSLLQDLQQAARSSDVDSLKDLPPNSSIWRDSDYLFNLVGSSEDLAHITAQTLSGMLYEPTEKALEVEIMVQLLSKICQLSSLVTKEVVLWLANQEDEHVFNVPVTMALLQIGLIEFHRVDYLVAKALHQRKEIAISFLAEMMDMLLFTAEPVALRSDFALCLDALSQWNADDPSLSVGQDIMRKLKESGIPDVVNPVFSDKDRARLDQMRYIFEEWLGLLKNPRVPDRVYAAFIKEMHEKQVMNTQEDSALFFRLCIDECVNAFDQEEFNGSGSLEDMFMGIDGLAKLIILMVKFQGESRGAVKASKPAYLNSILSLLILVLNNHHIVRGEQFNQRVFFRLFSSILCEYYDNALTSTEQNREMVLVFAEKFLMLQPFHVPGFAFAWLGLVSHRAFVTSLLNMPDEAGWESYCQLMQAMLSYMGELLKAANSSPVSMDLYRGVLRILLVLHHDFPEFVAENHFRLCNVIPAHCTQLRNLILSAYPSSFQELPDPFTAGLKVDRLEEIRKAPRIAGDYQELLQQAGVKEVLDSAFRSSSILDATVFHLVEAVTSTEGRETAILFEPLRVNIPLMNAIVLYIGQQAVSAVGHKGGPTFANGSPHANLLVRLARELHPEVRYYFLGAIANQLRYPNSHTHYFSYAVLHLFGADPNDQLESDIRQQITRVLLERLNVHRPHPWGLIITLLELLKNPKYTFWDLPFIKAAPEVSRMLSTLFSHIDQSSRAMS